MRCLCFIIFVSDGGFRGPDLLSAISINLQGMLTIVTAKDRYIIVKAHDIYPLINMYIMNRVALSAEIMKLVRCHRRCESALS